MSDNPTDPQPPIRTDTPDTPTLKDVAPAHGAGAEVVMGQGRTVIADTVVAKIAGIAAREVSGVHTLGGGTGRAVDALRELIPGNVSNHSQGVSVEVGERQAAVDLDLTAEYGVAIADLATSVRRNVIASVERMTGLEVSEVNITVQDVFLESEEDESGRETSPDARRERDADREPRVQ